MGRFYFPELDQKPEDAFEVNTDSVTEAMEFAFYNRNGWEWMNGKACVEIVRVTGDVEEPFLVEIRLIPEFSISRG